MSRTFQFRKNLEVYVNPQCIFELLGDLRNQLILNASLCEIRLQEDHINNKGQRIIQFIAIEEISIFGIIPLRSKHYFKLLLHESENRIEFKRSSFPGVEIIALIHLYGHASGKTIIKDDLKVKTPFFLRKYFLNAADNTHESMLRTLKLRLEEK